MADWKKRERPLFVPIAQTISGAAAAVALEIERNRVGFRGYNNGNNRTYGFLNSVDLPAYVTVSNGASGSSEWSTKTFLEIVADLRGAFSELRTQSQEKN